MTPPNTSNALTAQPLPLETASQFYVVGRTLQRWGQRWTVERRTGDVALIRQDFVEGDVRFITAIVLRHKVDRIFPNGDIIRAGTERLPGQNEFGDYAWQWLTRATAEKYFEKLTQPFNHA
jgi:hypothetical protein